MMNLLKDIAVLIYSAGDELEHKIEDHKKERKERHEKYEKELVEARKHLGDKFGLASTSQVDDLKKQIDALSKKIDKIKG